MADWSRKHLERVYEAGQNSVQVSGVGTVTETPPSDAVLSEPPLYDETHVYQVWARSKNKQLVSINARSREEADSIFERRRSAGIASEYIGELNDLLDLPE